MNTPASFLDANQLRATAIVRHIETFDTLTSTNDRAAELARDAQVELPALVIARRQTAGRGRRRNTWWSADGALTFSLLVDPSSTGVIPANWPQLSLATAVAVCDALAGEFTQCNPTLDAVPQPSPSGAIPISSPPRAIPHPSPSGILPIPSPSGRGQGEGDPNMRRISNRQPCLGIKWPNDVLIDYRKICGILLESPGSSNSVAKRLIIGIGINVNNSWHDAPPDINTHGTALCDVTGRQHDLQTVLTAVLHAWSHRADQLHCNDTALIHTWQRLNLLADQSVVVECDGRSIAGQCEEIAHDGALVVDTQFGRQRLYSGTVRVES